MARTDYTLILPIAVECSEAGAIEGIRIVKCKVRVNEIKKAQKSKDMTNLLQCELTDIDIEEVLSTSVHTVSLTDLSADKTLRNKIYRSASHYGSIFILGVRAITYICAGGRTINPYVFHPLVSHKGEELTKIHGIFDYMGKFHVHISEIPMRPIFAEEIKDLRAHRFKMTDRGKLPTYTAETLTASLPTTDSRRKAENMNTELQAPLVAGGAGAEAAIQDIVGAPHIIHMDDRLIYSRSADAPVIIVPEGVQQVRIDGNEPILQVLKLPTTAKQLVLLTYNTPQLQGIAQLCLAKMRMNIDELTQFDLPTSFKATADNKGTVFVLECYHKVHYLGELLNLSSIMYDAREVRLILNGQAWTTVHIPLATATVGYFGRVDQPVFNLVVTMPQLQMFTLSQLTRRVDAYIAFDANVEGAKQANLNLQLVQDWTEHNIVAKTEHDNGYNGIDGTKQVLNICTGAPKVTETGRYNNSVLRVSTDCSISENIVGQHIPVLTLFIKKLPLEDGQQLAAAGTTYIKANVDCLCILIDSYAKEGPVKDIYIDGRVNFISVAFTTTLTEKSRERNIKRIRIHVKQGTTATFEPMGQGYEYGYSVLLEHGSVRFKKHTAKLDVSKKAANLILVQDL